MNENPQSQTHSNTFLSIRTLANTQLTINSDKSAPKGAWKCNFSRFQEIMIDRPTNPTDWPTIRQTNRVIGKLHFHELTQRLNIYLPLQTESYACDAPSRPLLGLYMYRTCIQTKINKWLNVCKHIHTHTHTDTRTHKYIHSITCDVNDPSVQGWSPPSSSWWAWSSWWTSSSGTSTFFRRTEQFINVHTSRKKMYKTAVHQCCISKRDHLLVFSFSSQTKNLFH